MLTPGQQRVGGFLIVIVVFFAVVSFAFSEIHHNAATNGRLGAQQAQIRQTSIDAAVQSALVSCQSSNEVRLGVTTFIAVLTANAKRNAQAIVTNPTATRQQLVAAHENLKAIQQAQDSAGQLFAQKNCATPLPLKVLPTTTSTTTIP